MNAQEAKEILLLYRPGTADAEDPQIIEAIGFARQDLALAEWFERHCAFQKAMRAGFRQIQAPAHFKTAILVGKDFVPPAPPRRRAPVWLAATVCLLLLLALGLAQFWTSSGSANHYEQFQARMLSTVLREYSYHMDMVTNSMPELRSYLAAHGAPSDYKLTPGLARRPLTGGGALRWQGNPVSMVCFDRGDKQMLFLFVLKRSALKDPPRESPQSHRQGAYLAVSWTRGDNTYLLAGPEEPNFLQKYY